MSDAFLIIILISSISISITSSYTSINDRFAYNIDNDQAELLLNKTRSFSSSSNMDDCIGIKATQELGCTFARRNILFQELFQSTCVRHQLCYACGFVHGITAGECNRLAYKNMHHLCSNQNLLSSKSDCLRKRFSALNLLREHIYRSASENHEFLIECYDECVHKYLYAD